MKKKTFLIIVFILLIGILSVTNVYAAKANNVAENICNEVETIRVLKTANVVVTIFRFFVPILIIIFASIKFINSITSIDDKVIYKDLKNFLLRLVVGLFVFFLPTMIDAVLSFTNYYTSSKACYQCIFNADACKETMNTSAPN